MAVNAASRGFSDSHIYVDYFQNITGSQQFCELLTVKKLER